MDRWTDKYQLEEWLRGLDQVWMNIAHGKKKEVSFFGKKPILPSKLSMIHPNAMYFLPNKFRLVAYK